LPEFVDPYLDPRTGLLRNLVGADTDADLVAAEGALVFTRAVQLHDQPPKPTGDLAELQAIHRHLFQDLFDWAGTLRTVDIRKNTEGAEFFLPVSLIERASAYVAEQLHADNNLKGMSRDQFIDRLAHHYDELNYLHPFREGNGRTQRVFWSRIARDAGWQLDWRPVQGNVNDAACRIAQEKQDLDPLRDMFDNVVSLAVSTSDRNTEWHHEERERLGLGRRDAPRLE
jgi:cell filamentation protein